MMYVKSIIKREVMKVLKMTVAVLLILFAVAANAQTSQAIKDEDLRKYAATMDSVDGMQKTLVQIITERVQKNDVMSVARYNELYKMAGDETKLKEVNATAEERAFVKDIADLRQYNIDRINSAYQALAKDYVGLKEFNAIRKGLENDPELKERLEAMQQETAGSTSSETPGNQGK